MVTNVKIDVYPRHFTQKLDLMIQVLSHRYHCSGTEEKKTTAQMPLVYLDNSGLRGHRD
jgi:hypothetical protein